MGNLLDDVPVVFDFRPDQADYFAHLLSSWYGWKVGGTGFMMPTQYWCREIVNRLRKAAKTTLQNRP